MVLKEGEKEKETDKKTDRQKKETLWIDRKTVVKTDLGKTNGEERHTAKTKVIVEKLWEERTDVKTDECGL